MSDYPDFEGPKSGLYLSPEWAAKEGTDINLIAVNANIHVDSEVYLDYTVPAGTTLVINQMSIQMSGAAYADRELNQMCEVALDETVGGLWLPRERVGGNGGASLPLNKPRVFIAGQLVRLRGINHSNHNCDIAAIAAGYQY